MVRKIVQVVFHNNNFLSGSIDGMVNVFDIANSFDEDGGFLVSPGRIFDCSLQFLCVFPLRFWSACYL